MKKHWKRAAGLLLGFTVLVGALVYSIRTNPEWQKFDSGLFWASFGRIDWQWVAVAVLAIYATYLVRAFRWQVLIRPIKSNPGLWNLLSATVMGFGVIGVMGRPGELVRPYLIARKEAVPISGQLAVWVLERSFDSLVMLAMVAFAVWQFPAGQPDSGALSAEWWNSLALGVGFGTILILALLIVLRNHYEAVTGRLVRLLRAVAPARLSERIDSLEHILSVFGEGLHSLRRGRSVFQCLIWSAVLWLVIAVSYLAILRGCDSGVEFDLVQATIFMGLAMAGSMFQVPGVGGGFQIASLLALTEVFGMEVELATSASLLIWLVTFMAIVPPGVLLLLHDGISWARLREIESEV